MNLKRVITILLLAAYILPGIAMAQTPETVTLYFLVEKDFTDDNPMAVDATITCNVGLPLSQDIVLTDGNPVLVQVPNVVVPFIPAIRCEIVEDNEHTGYGTKYYPDGDTDGPMNKTSCLYTVFEEEDSWPISEFNECFIENQPDWVEVSVDKTWDLTGGGGNAVSTNAWIDVKTKGKLQDGYKCGKDNDRWCQTLYLFGDDSDSFLVRPSWDGTNVNLTEYVGDSAVESTNTCGGEVTVYPGEGAECSFENTVFFEGIPTLSQYGLALMALLMLGMGFVGFRRFV